MELMRIVHSVTVLHIFVIIISKHNDIIYHILHEFVLIVV